MSRSSWRIPIVERADGSELGQVLRRAEMPMKPKPITYACEECGWTKTVAPRSNALKEGSGLISVRSVGVRR